MNLKNVKHQQKDEKSKKIDKSCCATIPQHMGIVNAVQKNNICNKRITYIWCKYKVLSKKIVIENKRCTCWLIKECAE